MVSASSAASTALDRERAAASACEQYYARELGSGHCRCLKPTDNANASIKAALASQRASTTVYNRDDGGTGGLAVLLRGGAFRGSLDDTAADREAAQMQCVWSVVRRLVQPLTRDGMRVRVFLAVYDNVNATAMALLRAPFAEHLAAVTTLSARVSEQVTTAANALRAFLDHCEAASESFEAVVLTRFDLHFKMDVGALLGGPPSSVRGIRFLWRELEAGTSWRLLWAAAYLNNPRFQHSSVEVAHLNHTIKRQQRERSLALTPKSWRRTMRTADTLHAFSFAFARCFHQATLLEMTRDWKPAAGGASWRPSAVRNHWLHKMRYHVARAARDGNTSFLINGTFDSNPCASTCMLNPVYDILPRESWVVDSGICQAPGDFVFDPTSETLCCPSPDYCCPNSVDTCSDERAVLYDATAADGGRGVPTTLLEEGWRRHFLRRSGLRPRAGDAAAPAHPMAQQNAEAASRLVAQWNAEAASRLHESACPPSDWTDGDGGRAGCVLAMTDASARLVRDAWLHAPNWTARWPENDDVSTTVSNSRSRREAHDRVG